MRKVPRPIQWSRKLVKCSDCGLQKLCLPKNLKQPEIDKLEALVTSNRSFQKGDYLYHTADKLPDLIVVKSGSAKTELISETGAVQIVGFYFPGDLLGLDSIASHQAVSSVVFLEDSSICTIPYPTFTVLSQQMPELHDELITRLSLEIVSNHEAMLALNNHSAEQLFAAFLLEMGNRQHHRGLPQNHLHLRMSRGDIANYLGLAAATVSRIIGKFERDGLIQVENRYFQITAYQALIDRLALCACSDIADIPA